MMEIISSILSSGWTALSGATIIYTISSTLQHQTQMGSYCNPLWNPSCLTIYTNPGESPMVGPDLSRWSSAISSNTIVRTTVAYDGEIPAFWSAPETKKILIFQGAEHGIDILHDSLENVDISIIHAVFNKSDTTSAPVLKEPSARYGGSAFLIFCLLLLQLLEFGHAKGLSLFGLKEKRIESKPDHGQSELHQIRDAPVEKGEGNEHEASRNLSDDVAANQDDDLGSHLSTTDFQAPYDTGCTFTPDLLRSADEREAAIEASQDLIKIKDDLIAKLQEERILAEDRQEQVMEQSIVSTMNSDHSPKSPSRLAYAIHAESYEATMESATVHEGQTEKAGRTKAGSKKITTQLRALQTIPEIDVTTATVNALESEVTELTSTLEPRDADTIDIESNFMAYGSAISLTQEPEPGIMLLERQATGSVEAEDMIMVNGTALLSPKLDEVRANQTPEAFAELESTTDKIKYPVYNDNKQQDIEREPTSLAMQSGELGPNSNSVITYLESHEDKEVQKHGAVDNEIPTLEFAISDMIESVQNYRVDNKQDGRKHNSISLGGASTPYAYEISRSYIPVPNRSRSYKSTAPKADYVRRNIATVRPHRRTGPQGSSRTGEEVKESGMGFTKEEVISTTHPADD